jgi:16S rRNA U1498 N3-methylase RsmE
MAEPWQKPLIARCKQSVREILTEIEAADDLDLWEEIDGKATDVILTYRHSQREQAAPTHFTFSDGVTRNIDVMAASHAAVEIFPEPDQDDELPALSEEQLAALTCRSAVNAFARGAIAEGRIFRGESGA